MKIQERLDLITRIDNNKLLSENDELIINQEPDIFNIFERDAYSEKIITSLVNQNKNIIVVSDINIEKEFPIRYIRKFVNSKEKVEVLYDANKELSYISASKIFVPETSVSSLVKILEYIIYGFKSFVVGFSLNSGVNFIEKMKLLIALNYKNLSEINIETLISSSNLAVIFIDKNYDGLFYVKEIAEVVSLNNRLSLKSTYEFINLDNLSSINLNVKPIKSEVQDIEIKQEEIKHKEEVKQEEEIEQDIVSDSSFIQDDEIDNFESVEHIENSTVEEENDVIVGNNVIEENQVSIDEDIVEEESIDSTVQEKEVVKDQETNIDNQEIVQMVEVPQEQVKANKYKLLKEKIKMKKFNL